MFAADGTEQRGRAVQLVEPLLPGGAQQPELGQCQLLAVEQLVPLALEHGEPFAQALWLALLALDFLHGAQCLRQQWTLPGFAGVGTQFPHSHHLRVQFALPA